MFVRPTSLGFALLNAAVKAPTRNMTADRVLTVIMKNDNPDAPIKSGYNRVMKDNIRVSAKTLARI